MQLDEPPIDSKEHHATSQERKEATVNEQLAIRFAAELNRLLPEIVDRELAKVLAALERGRNQADAQS